MQLQWLGQLGIQTARKRGVSSIAVRLVLVNICLESSVGRSSGGCFRCVARNDLADDVGVNIRVVVDRVGDLLQRVQHSRGRTNQIGDLGVGVGVGGRVSRDTGCSFGGDCGVAVSFVLVDVGLDRSDGRGGRGVCFQHIEAGRQSCVRSVAVRLVLIYICLNGSHCGCGGGISFQYVQTAAEGGVGVGTGCCLPGHCGVRIGLVDLPRRLQLL